MPQNMPIGEMYESTPRLRLFDNALIEGFNKRDAIALEAMKAFLSKPYKYGHALLGEECYEIADAMIAASEKGQQPK